MCISDKIPAMFLAQRVIPFKLAAMKLLILATGFARKTFGLGCSFFGHCSSSGPNFKNITKKCEITKFQESSLFCVFSENDPQSGSRSLRL